MTITQHRDLRTGAPVWMAYGTRIPAGRRLLHSIKTDVLVVGAGISGILTAHLLTALGQRVVMVDRRSAVLGSTPASTALLQFEIDTPLIKLQRKLGARPAQAAWLRSLAALRALHQTILAAGLDPAMGVRPSLLLAGDQLDARGLAAEVRARQRIGLPSQYLSRKGLRDQFGLRRNAAILSQENLQLNPRALASGLLRRALAGGARLYAPQEVIAVDSSARHVISHLKDGNSIQSRQVVFCTGYEMLSLVPMAGHKIASSWVMATRPQPRRLWPQQALIWEASDPYLYVRATADGRVICGGEDETYSDSRRRDAAIAAKTQVLQRKLHALLPEVDATVDYAWAGSFGQSSTGLPTIGAIPGYPRCYAVLGYGGNGITFSMLAAQLISKAILGERDPDAGLFAFGR